jgi:hypothetical protein
MAHKCGFTHSVLAGSFSEAGFTGSFGGKRPAQFDIWLVAFKAVKTENEMKDISLHFLP